MVAVDAGTAVAAVIVAAVASPADVEVMPPVGVLALGLEAGVGDRDVVLRAAPDDWGMTVLACRLGMLRAS